MRAGGVPKRKSLNLGKSPFALSKLVGRFPQVGSHFAFPCLFVEEKTVSGLCYRMGPVDCVAVQELKLSYHNIGIL